MDLTEISKQCGVAVEELLKIEIELRKKYSPLLNVLTVGQMESYINTGIQQHINKYKNLGLEQYFGVILTLSQPKDSVARRRSIAIKKYIEDPDVSIASGMIQEYKDGNKKFLSKGMVVSKPVPQELIPKTAMYLPDQKVHVVPCDERESWPNGKKNYNYLNPLAMEQYFSNIEGICSLDGSNWEPFKMMFNCPEHINVTNVTIPQSKIVKFLAKVKSKPPLVLNFNNKYTKFELVPGDITTLNLNIMNFYDIVPISEIDTVYKSRKTNYDIVAIFGQIGNKWVKEPTEEKPAPWATGNIRDNSSDKSLKLLIHPDMSAQFEEGSLAKIWGSLSEGNKWDSDLGRQTDEKEITMFVTGVHSFSQEIEEQKIDDGWES